MKIYATNCLENFPGQIETSDYVRTLSSEKKKLLKRHLLEIGK